MGLALAGTTMVAQAESVVYTFDYLGEVDGMADNGQYAAITDSDEGYAYLWRARTPDMLIDISEIPESDNLPSSQMPIGTTAMDVSNDGIVVGSIQFKDYHQHPAYFENDEWHLLPLDPGAMYTNEAVCITPDGSVIAGYQFIRDPGADQGARYYPCQWFRQPNGEYELKAYTDIELPDHQGFWPMTQTPDGKVIGGTVYCGIGSRINALIKEGELVLFDEIETKYEPWLYKGKYYAGEIETEDGKTKQLWVEDVNDPRVVLFPEVYINGYHDGLHGADDFLEGIFANCDNNGNFYGCRNRLENVTEDGDGERYSDACIYNYLTDTWYTEEGINFFSAGVGEELLFTGDGDVIEGDKFTSVREAYNVVTEYTIQGINKISWDGKTLGGVASEMHPATGELMYYPFIVVVDGGTSDVPVIAGSPKKGLVIATQGRIEVLNAEEVAVYDLNGRLVGNDKVTEVSAGIYVVKADDASYKVRVK